VNTVLNAVLYADADPVPDRTFRSCVYPDPTFHSGPDPDPTFLFDADSDPDPSTLFFPD